MAEQEINNSDRIVAEERDRLLASPQFQRSPVLSRLLKFLIDHRLRGGRAAPKAYAVATEALGRDADFDPAVDSYPRVMVGRLRNLLDRYYAETDGLHRLRIPHGSYEILIQRRDEQPVAVVAEQQAAPGQDSDARTDHHDAKLFRRNRLAGVKALLITLLVFALAGSAGWWLNQSPESPIGKALVPAPLVEITPPVAGDSDISQALSRGLEAKLRDGLRRFEAIQLHSARGANAKATKRQPDYRLDSTIVRTIDGPIDVTLVLNRTDDERTIWSKQIRVTEPEVPEFIAFEPAISKIAGDYGVIVQDQLEREPQNYSVGYPCFAQYNRVRQMRTATNSKPVAKCLRASLKRDPTNPQLLSALSLLRYSEWQPLRDDLAGKTAFLEAEDLAKRASDAGPNTSAGLFSLARANFYKGNCERGISIGEAAIERNPFDADMIGYFGLFDVACGDMVNGEKLLRRSLWLDDSHAGVPAVTLAFILSQRGENDEGLAVLNRMPSPSNMEPQYLMVRAIIYARNGKMVEARQLWKKLLLYTKQPSDAAPETVLQKFMITPKVIKRAAEAVRETGLSTTRPPS